MKSKIFLVFLFLIIINVYKVSEEEIIIPNNSIRLRIIPNSNNPYDIKLKEEVKEDLEKTIYKDLKNVKSIEEARTIISNTIPTIEKNIENIFKNNGYEKTFKINFGQNYFPEKTYKGKTYSEGNYESLVVEIGEANGDNFWCVLFPNFCLIDLDSDIEYESYIYNIIKKYSK